MTARGSAIAGAAGALALLVFGAVAIAQAPGPGRPGMGFFGGPGFGGKVVTGYPFSAQAVSTFSETLNGGNTISRTECAIIARDGNGDTYEAVTPDADPNSPTCSSSTAKTIAITNVAAGMRYFINVTKRTYRQMALKTPPPGGRPPREGRNSKNVQKTDLGSSTISGVPANGTQIVRTIPAGQIGNAEPITITSTTWIAPSLETVVQSSRVDSSRGTSNYQLSNIVPGEPRPSFFTLPSGLTLEQGGRRRGFQRPPAQ